MFYWDDELLTGIKEIDDDHKELCIRANKLFEAFIEGKLEEEIRFSMNYFEEYIHTHLDAEEKLLIDMNYPKYKYHKAKHDAFKKIFEELKSIITTQGINNTFVEKFNYTIVDWLTFHLREDDADFAKFIHSSSPAKIKA